MGKGNKIDRVDYTREIVGLLSGLCTLYKWFLFYAWAFFWTSGLVRTYMHGVRFGAWKVIGGGGGRGLAR